MTAFAKNLVIRIRVQIADILLAPTLQVATFVNAPHLHAVAVTNAKRHLPEFRMTKTHQTQAYVKCYRPKLAQRTKTVRRKRNVVTDTASSAPPVQKTAIAPLQNGAAKTDIVS